MKDKKRMTIVAAIYLVTFFVTVLIAGYILNYHRIHPSKDQGDTSLIRLHVQSSGLVFNEMYGYREEMEPQYMRLNMTPVYDDQKITLLVDEYTSEVRSIRYSLLNEDGEEVESGDSVEIKRIEGKRQAEICLKSALKPRKEYYLHMTVEDDQNTICHYYTSLISGEGMMAYDELKFAMDFHQAIFEKTSTERIAEHMIPSNEGISDDFQNVSIESDSETVTWGQLQPEVVSDVSMSILNLTEENGEIQMVYGIAARDDSGNDYHYMVREYFNISATGSNIELLDYKRTMTEELDDQSFMFNNSLLRLGIIDKENVDLHIYGKEKPKDVEVPVNAKDEYNTYMAFVADGELWVYNTRDNLLTQAFGFEQRSTKEYRESSYLMHDIKILKTEENGDLYFAVYGYMYNGENEGSYGISINHYNRVEGSYSEELFIPYRKDYSVMGRGLDRMAFVDDDQMLYIVLEERIYKIDIVMKEYEILYEDIDSPDFAISQDGHSVAIACRTENGNVDRIEWQDLSTGDKRTITSDGKKLELFGMLGENLVYGTAELSAPEGCISALSVVSTELEVLKKYEMTDGWITDVYPEKDMLVISRKNKKNEVQPEDYILYNTGDTSDGVIQSVYHDVRMDESWLDTNTYGNEAPVVLFGRPLEVYRNNYMAFDPPPQEYSGFFVYQDTKSMKFDEFREAYDYARERGGKLEDSQGRTVCVPSQVLKSKNLKGDKIDQVGTDTEAQQKAVLKWIYTYEGIEGEPNVEGSDMFKNMEQNLPDYDIVDLSGMNIDQALAMVAANHPLVVRNSEGTWCIVKGYKKDRIIVADPKDAAVTGYEWDSVVQGIASSGNIIFSYY